jgi:hypothetical protein
MEWSFQGYINAMGFFFWPILFTAIIVYVYLKNQSMVAAAVAILIIVTVFSNAFAGVNPYLNFLYIVVSLIVSGLILMIFIKRGG